MLTTNNSHPLPPPPDSPILTFPVIHPCPCASPSTLLPSLLALAIDIRAFRSHLFPSLRRAIRESLREVSILHVFLHEVNRYRCLQDSAAVSLWELHAALQKLRQVLADCSRRGAHLWVLMNAGRVVSEIRLVIRSISTALDVLPLDCIDVDGDVKEMVRVLARQSWTVEIGTDREDERAVRAVRSIVGEFGRGMSPDAADLRRVLDYLDIKNWADCNEEISLLEEEMLEYRHEEEDNSQAALLGSLMGFLIYCRSVVSESVSNSGGTSISRKDFESKENGFVNCLDAESLWCPISLELMTDPVAISTGQTYDRASITRWFKDGYQTCPVTGEKLDNTDTVPNLTLQKLIRSYCHLKSIPITEPSSNRKCDLGKTINSYSVAMAEATRMTALFLVEKLSRGSEEEKKRAAYEIRLLTKSSLFNRACFVESDSVPWLLHLISSSDPSIQDHAIAALLNISKHPSGKTAIFEIGGLSLVVGAINEGLKIETTQNAAAIVFYLTSVHEYRQEIGQIPEAIPALVNLLKKGGTYRGKKNAVVALFGLLLFPGNHQKVLAAGVIPVIADLLTDENKDLVNDCVGVLAKIAETKEGSRAILRSPMDVLPKLGKILESSTARSGREYSVSVMLSLCNNGGRNVIGLLDKMPLVMPSLYSIVVAGPPQASKKARALINHIHQMHEEDYTVASMNPQSYGSCIIETRL